MTASSAELPADFTVRLRINLAYASKQPVYQEAWVAFTNSVGKEYFVRFSPAVKGTTPAEQTILNTFFAPWKPGATLTYKGFELPDGVKANEVIKAKLVVTLMTAEQKSGQWSTDVSVLKLYRKL